MKWTDVAPSATPADCDSCCATASSGVAAGDAGGIDIRIADRIHRGELQRAEQPVHQQHRDHHDIRRGRGEGRAGRRCVRPVMMPFQISVLRKPKFFSTKGTIAFICMRAERDREGDQPRLERRQVEADLQHQRQDEGQGANAAAEQEAADEHWRGRSAASAAKRSRIGEGWRRA